jgi:hypothetical protein
MVPNLPCGRHRPLDMGFIARFHPKGRARFLQGLAIHRPGCVHRAPLCLCASVVQGGQTRCRWTWARSLVLPPGRFGPLILAIKPMPSGERWPEREGRRQDPRLSAPIPGRKQPMFPF